MFCPVCGKQISDNAKFCPFCGTTMQSAQEVPQQTTYSQAPQQQMPYPQASYSETPYQQNPYQQAPYQQAPYQGQYQQNPYQQNPYQQPYPQQPIYNQTYQKPVSEQTPAPEKESSPNKGLLIALCSIAVLLLLGIIAVVIVMFVRSDQEGTKPERPNNSSSAPVDPSSKDDSDKDTQGRRDDSDADPVVKPDGQGGSTISGGPTVPNNGDLQQAPNFPAVTVSGQLKNKTTGAPLSNVILVLLNDDVVPADYHYATTDENGAYTFEEVPVGNYILLLDNDSYPYFEPFTVEVTGEEATLSMASIEINMPADYYAFLREHLIPAYGLADLSEHSKTVTTDTFQQDVYWDDRSGIVSADIVDLNVDGTDEMVLYRFSYYNSEYFPTPVLGLYVEVYTQNEKGEIYGTEPVLVQDCISGDANEVRCALVPHMYGYFVMVQNIYHPEGTHRVFTGGLPSAPVFYSFDGVKLFKDVAISVDTAGSTPYHTTLSDGSTQDFTSMEDAIASAGIHLDVTPLTGDYYYGNFAFFTSFQYRCEADGEGNSALITTTLTDLTYLRPELEIELH